MTLGDGVCCHEVLKCVRLNGMGLKWMLKIGPEVLSVECVWYEVSNVYLVRDDQVQDVKIATFFQILMGLMFGCSYQVVGSFV